MSSPVSASSSPRTASMSDIDDTYQSNGLLLERAPFGLEEIQDYDEGGHHPVHLGDVISQRYRVIHKLGNGGFANIWLCRDLTESGFKYNAIKIIMAEYSTTEYGELHLEELKAAVATGGDDGAAYVSLPISQFEIEGPNGTHLCFVYQVLGPKVSSGKLRSGDRDLVLKNVCHRIVGAVDFIHRHGICHGDITAANVLHKATGLDGQREEDVVQILGEPDLNRVLSNSREAHDQPGAPQYLVYPVQWYDVDDQYISPEPSLIDFGESFKQSSLPEDFGIPRLYQAPEMLLEQRTAGIPSDLWALGCTLFEIRTGRKLFNLFDDGEDDYLDAMVKFLGPLPEPWWSTTWEGRKVMWRDEPDEQGHAVCIKEKAEPEVEENETDECVIETVHPSVPKGARSLRDLVAPGVWYVSDTTYMPGPKDELHREIDPAEVEVFADLLGCFLRYRPEDRVSAKEALRHEYFRDL